jgi:hypothetical protein
MMSRVFRVGVSVSIVLGAFPSKLDPSVGNLVSFARQGSVPGLDSAEDRFAPRGLDEIKLTGAEEEVEP